MNPDDPRRMRHGEQPSALNDLTGRIIEAAMAVHSALGPGLVERAYRVGLSDQIRARGLACEEEVHVPVTVSGVRIEAGFRADLIVGGRVIVEVKSVEALHPVHFAQVLTYLRLTGCPVGLLLNFNVAHLRNGIRRVVAGMPADGADNAGAADGADGAAADS